MKKVISILLTLCILGAAGYFGWQAYQKYIAKPADSGSAALVTPYTTLNLKDVQMCQNML